VFRLDDHLIPFGVSMLPILTIHEFGDEDGVELFYNAAVTPWFHVSHQGHVEDGAKRVQILDPDHNVTSPEAYRRSTVAVHRY
jgi:hypothetical protein